MSKFLSFASTNIPDFFYIIGFIILLSISLRLLTIKFTTNKLKKLIAKLDRLGNYLNNIKFEDTGNNHRHYEKIFLSVSIKITIIKNSLQGAKTDEHLELYRLSPNLIKLENIITATRLTCCYNSASINNQLIALAIEIINQCTDYLHNVKCSSTTDIFGFSTIDVDSDKRISKVDSARAFIATLNLKE